MGDTAATGQMITAGFGGVVAGSLISWAVQASLLGRRITADKQLGKERFDYEKQLAERKFSFDREIAERRFSQEREQIVYKRHFELAEGILADAYRLRGLVRDARLSGSFGREGTTRKSEKEESERAKETKDMYFVPVERLQRHAEFFAGFFAKQFTAAAQFGPKAKDGFEAFTQALDRIYLSSTLLISMVDQPSLDDHKVKDSLLDDLWRGRAEALGREDKIEAQIERAIVTLEGIFRPVLEKTSL
jgi:hypothetical protein